MENALTIKISSTIEQQEQDLTVAEIGVLFTAVNRSLNKIALTGMPHLDQQAVPRYHSIIQEPNLVQLKLQSVKKGSLEVQVIIDTLNAIGLDQASAKSILLSVLASAIYDPNRAKIIASDMSRAVSRITNGAIGKTFTLAISTKNAIAKFSVNVDDKQKVIANRYPPDDIQ